MVGEARDGRAGHGNVQNNHLRRGGEGSCLMLGDLLGIDGEGVMLGDLWGWGGCWGVDEDGKDVGGLMGARWLERRATDEQGTRTSRIIT